jgi:hypothetical protein
MKSARLLKEPKLTAALFGHPSLTQFRELFACDCRLDNSACEETSAPWLNLFQCVPDAQPPQTDALMHLTAQSYLTTVQPVPSVEVLPHSAGEVGSILSTTPELRCMNRLVCGHLRFSFSYTVDVSRYDKPSHRVYMTFFQRDGWYVQFLESDLKTPLPKKLSFSDP